MKIIIASTIVPFISGGGTFIVDWLAEKLNEYGHETDVIRIPFLSSIDQYLEQALALRLYHLEDACERLICIRMPSYLIKHEEKYLWFIHHYREVYDLWGTELDALSKNEKMLSIRECIKRMDDTAFTESKKIYTNSQIVSKRLLDYNGVLSTPLYPPLLHPETFQCDSYGEYIFYASRVCAPKRQLLAIEAMQYTKTPVRLVIGGKTDEMSYGQQIENFIQGHELQDKVQFQNRWITEQEKALQFANCLAAVYIPFDEDSYGYTSLEAYYSEKAVISCTDSGGTSELIVDGENGYLVEPTPQALAERFDQLYEDKSLAERMGKAGRRRVDELGINWDTVIGRFTA